jgi:hypothetical protein
MSIEGSVFIAIYILTAIGVFIGRNWLKASIERAVQHRFDEKIEALRTELRKGEETFKSELRLKETEIAALRDGILNGRAQRQALFNQRRMQAVERVWSAINILAPFRVVSEFMARINFSVVAEEAAGDRRIQEFAAMITKNVPDMKTFEIPAKNEQPFVSALAWAYFSAYQMVVLAAYMRAKVLEFGLNNAAKLFNNEPIKALLKAALPHQSEYIDQYDASAYHFLLDELQERLLAELQKMLRGEDQDAASVAQAAIIMKLVGEVRAQTERAETSTAAPEGIAAAI